VTYVDEWSDGGAEDRLNRCRARRIEGNHGLLPRLRRRQKVEELMLFPFGGLITEQINPRAIAVEVVAEAHQQLPPTQPHRPSLSPARLRRSPRARPRQHCRRPRTRTPPARMGCPQPGQIRFELRWAGSGLSSFKLRRGVRSNQRSRFCTSVRPTAWLTISDSKCAGRPAGSNR
jgi:hypothetical protein